MMCFRTLKNQLGQYLSNYVIFWGFIVFLAAVLMIAFYEPKPQYSAKDQSGLKTQLETLEERHNWLIDEVIRSEEDPSLNAEKLYASLEQIALLHNTIDSDWQSSLAEDKQLSVALQGYLDIVERTLGLIEHYAEQRLLYRDTAQKLPVGRAVLVAKLREHGHGERYVDIVDSLYEQTQRFAQKADFGRVTGFIAYIKRSDSKLRVLSPPMDELSSFVTHCRTLVESRVAINESLLRLQPGSTAPVYAELLQIIDLNDKVETASVTNARLHYMLWGLAFMSILLAFKYRELLSTMCRENAARGWLLIRGNRDQSYNDETRIDTVLASLAHQLSTPLQHIQNNIDALAPALEEIHGVFSTIHNQSDQNRWPESLRFLLRSGAVTEFPFAAAEISESIRRVSDVIGNMQHYAKADRENKAPLDINTIIREVLKTKSKRIHRLAQLRLSLSEQLPVIEGVLVDLQHMIDSLIDNAIEAIDDTDVASRFIEITTTVQESVMTFMVRDNGVGMPSDTLENMYQPFFTTKDGHMGMGLTMVNKTVTRHAGNIRIVSHIDSGTIVRIRLPLSSDKTLVDANRRHTHIPTPKTLDSTVLKPVGDQDKTKIMFRSKTISAVNQAPTTCYEESVALKHLVQELAETYGKKVELITHGLADVPVTADEKLLIREAAERCIRNAVEHGIEEPYYRLYLGKSQIGRIELGLRRGANEDIELVVSDDGVGIDHDGIRQRALACGVRTLQQLEHLDRNQLINLLFDERLSMNGRRQERGQRSGMNQLHEKITRVGGKIGVVSRKGFDTKVFMKIPRSQLEKIVA